MSVRDVQSADQSGAAERFIAARGAMPIDGNTQSGSDYFCLIKSVDHQALLSRYRALHGEKGELQLSDQFAQLFEVARLQTAVTTTSFARYGPGLGYFTAASGSDAERLAGEMIRVVDERNRKIPSHNLHKQIVAVILRPPARLEQPDRANTPWAAALQVTAHAEDLAEVAQPGELLISQSVHDALPPAAASAYNRCTGTGKTASGAGAFGQLWRRRVVDQAVDVSTVERAVLVVDMSRFSKIQDHMRLILGEAGASLLEDQIRKVIKDAFAAAGAEPYETLMNSWGGDGGTFLIEDPNVAHRVAVEIIKLSEDYHNASSRKSACDTGMRCFRVGIDHGRLRQSAAADEYAGEALTRATRLEEGGPSGELRVSEVLYQRLREDLRKAYGDRENIIGKVHDQEIPGRRLQVADRAPWPEVDRNNKPFPPVKQPNQEFAASQAPAAALERCFVICPLGEGHERIIDVYDRLIAPACVKSGFAPCRATDVPGDRKSIISENLLTAPLVIAYLGHPDHWNYNVILEVGIRLATGLPIVMLSERLSNGGEPDYQRLLPFQIVHHNVITIEEEPGSQIQKIVEEIGKTRTRLSRAWESPNPVLEFRYMTLDDILITDANEPARQVFGADSVRVGQSVEALRKFIADHTDPAQAAARLDEQMVILDSLLAHAVRGRRYAGNWQPPRARIPIVFNTAQPDPATGKPIGYLPVILRYHFDSQWTTVRYVYLRVSSAMHKAADSAYYTCDL